MSRSQSPEVVGDDLVAGRLMPPDVWDPAPSGFVAAVVVLVFMAALVLSGILLIG